MMNIDQLPISDLGLHCPACKTPLVGMAEYCCSHGGQAFNIRDLLAV